jgi:hypothetical protein
LSVNCFPGAIGKPAGASFYGVCRAAPGFPARLACKRKNIARAAEECYIPERMETIPDAARRRCGAASNDTYSTETQ